MALSRSSSLRSIYGWLIAKTFLIWAKSFLVWIFTLAVCLLVVGFPLVILMVTVGSLLAVILQSIVPMSSVLLVAGSILGLNVFAVIAGAGMLTAKGVHPDQVTWLRWLQGEENPDNTSIYAACPLTCAIRQ